MHYYNQFPFLSVIKVKYNAQHYLNTSSCTSLLFRIWQLATPKASPRLPIFFLPEKCFTFRYSTHADRTLSQRTLSISHPYLTGHARCIYNKSREKSEN